jgi:hypothetical protein
MTKPIAAAQVPEPARAGEDVPPQSSPAPAATTPITDSHVTVLEYGTGALGQFVGADVARQLERELQHTKHVLSVMERDLRQRIADSRNYVDALLLELAEAQAKLSEIREIYTGMEGFIPQTAPEAYQQRVLKQMYDAAIEAAKEKEHD